MRKPNWQQDFMLMVQDRKASPFEWGANDCALFAADAVLMIAGIDYASEFRGKYKTAKGAAKQLKIRGGLEVVLDDKLERIDANLTQRGDVVLFETDNGPTTGIYWNGGAFSTAPGGVEFFPNIRARGFKAWSY